MSIVVTTLLLQREYKQSSARILNNYFISRLGILTSEVQLDDHTDIERAVRQHILKQAAEIPKYTDRFSGFPAILDFWDIPCRFHTQQRNFKWQSAGQDKTFDTEDDILFEGQWKTNITEPTATGQRRTGASASML
jgi:hypothetical protein